MVNFIRIFSTKEFVHEVEDPPIIRLVNQILHQAIQQEASDIHFEPFEKNYRIRLRQDGILHEIEAPSIHLAPRLITRLKVMAELDISERRLPQDGRFKITLREDKTIEFRVSSCPTIFGEKIVMRIVDPARAITIEECGFETEQKKTFIKALKAPQGMILVTGPTGSGKTATLYAALNLLNMTEVNISTAEDPIEKYLPGINQVNIHPKAGLSFSTVLRAFLRQDPDIIMLGEIRDLETAQIAMHAAQTGHLLLSTLHTNSAAETITRLLNMGIPAFQIASTLSLVIAQRLARKLCIHCKESTTYPHDWLLEAGFQQHELFELKLFRARGCAHCLQGFKGRIGIYEIMLVNKKIEEMILKNKSSLEILQEITKNGTSCLRQSALSKVKLGIISLEEAIRVTKDK